ncbi:MAG: ATP-binding cassette domain-containing protein [Pirellulaceae bacterium]
MLFNQTSSTAAAIETPACELLVERPPSAMTVAYHRKPVLWNLSLDIPARSLVGIVGPNGAGKSTLLKTVAHGSGRISGEVQVFGQRYSGAFLSVGVPQGETVD